MKTRGVSAPYTIRAFRPGDEAACLRLLNEVFGRWPRSETAASPIEHLRWKTGGPYSFVHPLAEAEGMIVGMRTEMIRPARVGDTERSVIQGFDAAVHPDYRERGVMKAIRAWLPESRGDLQIGWSRNPAIIRLRKHEWAAPIGKGVHALVHDGTPPKAPAIAPCVVEDAVAFDDSVDELCQAAAPQFGFILARSKEFLNWRFCDRRAGDYVVRVARDGGRLLGYTVLSIGGGSGQVADALVLPERLDVLDALARDALIYFHDRGARPVEWWCASRHPYRRTLTDLGFERRRTIRYTYWPTAVDPQELSLLQDRDLVVHLMPGDTDAAPRTRPDGTASEVS